MIPIIGLQPDEIEGMWPHVRPFIEKAMQRTGVIKDHDPDYVFEQLRTLNMQCWVGHKDDRIIVVHVTKIDVFPKRKVLWVLFTGAVEGTIDDWIEHIEVFKAFAQEHGCEAVRGGGRLGWVKKLHPDMIRVEFDIEV